MYFWPKNGQNGQNKNFPRHNTAIQWFKATVPRFWPSFRKIWCAVSKKMSKTLILRLTSTPSDGPPLRFKTINLIQITKINLKNINGLKENGQKQSKSLSNVTTCNVFLTKTGQNGQNGIFRAKSENVTSVALGSPNFVPKIRTILWTDF